MEGLLRCLLRLTPGSVSAAPSTPGAAAMACLELQGITHQLQWGQSTEKRSVLLKLLCNGEAQLRITLNSEQDSNNLYLAWRPERLRTFVAYH